MKLLQYGLQRSGTNFMAALLKKNFQVSFLNSDRDRRSPLQKHFRFYDQKNFVPEPQYRNDLVVRTFAEFEALFAKPPQFYVVISKDPYSWYLSYRNWAQLCKWPAVGHHYIEEYNLFYGNFLKLAEQTDKILFVRYVDLLQTDQAELHRLASIMNLRRRSLLGRMTRMPRRVPQSGRFSDERRDYYLHRDFMREFTAAEVHELNARLDHRVAAALGYAEHDAPGSAPVARRRRQPVSIPHVGSRSSNNR